MSNFKRVGGFLLILIGVAVVMASFHGSDILNRAIILGIGIDPTEDGGIRLTAEVVSPGNGGEQVGTFSKTVTVEGRTIAETIQAVAEYTGKEASLGQCVVLVLGQQYYENVDFSDLIEYFINHHSFKESAVICCCEGSAFNLFNSGNALTQSISMSIATVILDEAKKVAVSNNNLLVYTRSQSELNKTGYLNKIKYVPSENVDSQDPDKTQGYLDYREIVVFRSNMYVCTLTEDEVTGMSLFIDSVHGEMFVSEVDTVTRTLRVSSKDIEMKPKNGGFEITITISVRYGRTDSEEVSGPITAKKDKEIEPKVLEDVKQQAQQLAEAYLAKQVELNFDLLKFHEMYRQQEGSSDALASKPMADFPVTLSVKVNEN